MDIAATYNFPERCRTILVPTKDGVLCDSKIFFPYTESKLGIMTHFYINILFVVWVYYYQPLKYSIETLFDLQSRVEGFINGAFDLALKKSFENPLKISPKSASRYFKNAINFKSNIWNLFLDQQIEFLKIEKEKDPILKQLLLIWNAKASFITKHMPILKSLVDQELLHTDYSEIMNPTCSKFE